MSERWSDWLEAELFERRTVFLAGALDEAAAGKLAAQLMTLDAIGDGAVQFHLDSAGGTMEGTAAVVDTIDLLGVPVHALCTGRADGPALFVLAVCDRRLAGPHAVLRLREPPASHEGTAEQLADWVASRRDQLHRLVLRLSEATGQSVARLNEELERGRFLTAPEAKELGLIDDVATAGADIVDFPRRIGYRLS